MFGPVNYTMTGTAPFVVSHNLSTDFVWNGTSNILIEMCFNNVNTGGGSTKIANVVSSTFTGTALYKGTDNSATACATATGSTSGIRPNMTFGYKVNAPITWSPAAGLSSTTGNTVTANPTVTTTYTATAKNTFNCTSSSTLTVTVTPALQVGAAISGPDNACAYMGNGSQLAVYTVATTNSSSITWTLPSGAINVTGQGTNTISFNYPMSFTSGNVSVLVASLAPCTATITRTLAIGRTVPSAPVVSGIVNVCNYVGTGVELTYTAAADANVTSYVWTVPPTVTIVSGQGTNSINVTLSPGFTASPNKQIRVRSVASCGSSDQAIYYLEAQLPQAAGQISGPTELCSYVGTSTQATYTIASVISASSYIWTLPSGATIVGSSTGTSINVVYDNTFSGGSIVVRAVNSCGTSISRSLTVKRTTPSMPGLISGPNNVCMLLPSVSNASGSTGVYSVNSVAGVTYVWNVPEGLVIESQTSTSTQNVITVSFHSTYSGGSTIGVIAVGECGTSPERTFNLAQLSPGAVGGILQVTAGSCADRTYVYNVANMPTNALSLEWTVPAGGTIISGQGTTTITVGYSGDAIAGDITAEGNNGCGNSPVARRFAVKLPACPPQEAPFVKSSIKTSTIPSDLLTEQLEVRVYPNPSVTTFKLNAISTNVNEVMHVRILDNLGREYKRMQMKSGETISFGSDLKAGSYFVEVIQGKNKTVKKVLKF